MDAINNKATQCYKVFTLCPLHFKDEGQDVIEQIIREHDNDV
jgi:hypothetical protein